MRRRAGLLGALALVLLASACSTPSPSTAGDVGVSVDTPLLRDLRAQGKVDPCRNGSAAPAESGLPQVTLPCLGGGESVDLSTLRGPMIIPLWASWCPGCREEMAYFQKFHERYGDRVPVLGLDFQDTTPEAALRLMLEKSATYPVVADPGGDVRTPFRVRGLPGIVFVDPDGSFHVRYLLLDSYGALVTLVEQELGLSL